jgi:hypothetical protein
MFYGLSYTKYVSPTSLHTYYFVIKNRSNSIFIYLFLSTVTLTYCTIQHTQQHQRKLSIMDIFHKFYELDKIAQMLIQ